MARTPIKKPVEIIESPVEVVVTRTDALETLAEQVNIMQERLSKIEADILKNDSLKRDLTMLVLKLERMGLLEHSVANSFGVLRS